MKLHMKLQQRGIGMGRYLGFLVVSVASLVLVTGSVANAESAGDCFICNPFGGGDCCGGACICEPGCADTFCNAACNPLNALCLPECGAIQPECNPLCGGDICADGCPDACTVACPDNLLCDTACGAVQPECLALCGGDVCGAGCPNECSLALCADNHCTATCTPNPECDALCGGDICTSGCPDACTALCPDNLICDTDCGAVQPECNALCGGDVCGSGCPDECSLAFCPQNHCTAVCTPEPECDALCGGDICLSGCPDACTALCPDNLICNTDCGAIQPECNILCGGNGCNSGCTDECNPISCPENPCSEQTPCGGEGQRACCLFESDTNCDSGLIEVGPCTGDDCGFGDCSLGICVDPQCGGEGERACCANEQVILGVGNCEDGLIEVEDVLGVGGCAGECECIGTGSLGASSTGMCHRYQPCGGEGQRACCIAERGNPCDEGLVEVPGCSGDCFCGGGAFNTVNDGVEGTSNSTCVRFEDITEPSLNHTPPTPSKECSLRGYMDMHLHLFADLAHGGAALAGRPFFDDLAGEDVNDALRPCYASESIIIDTDGNEMTLSDDPSPNGGCTPLGWGSIFEGGACPENIHPESCGDDSYKLHGCHGVFDEPIGSFAGTSDGAEFSLGAPSFNNWPQWSTTMHQQAYHRWLERAWKGGLRMVTMFAVTNGALCKGGKTKKYLDDEQTELTDCDNSMAFIDLQLRAAYDFQDFIDRRVGGGVDNDEGWFRIVLTPFEARQEIAKGNMAVVLGIEMANLFNCGFIAPGEIPECTPKLGVIFDPTACAAALTVNSDSVCTEAYVQSEVDRYYNDFGVRHIFPIHNFDNAFGGPATWQDGIEVGNRIIEKHWWSTRDCSDEDYGFGLGAFTQLMIGLLKFNDEIGVDELAALLLLRGVDFSELSFLDMVAAIASGIINPVEGVHCNEFGLFPLGSSLVTKLMDKGMIIDIDHMSNRSLENTITMAQNFDRDGDGTPEGYPLVASHALFFELNEREIRHERLLTEAQLLSIRNLGGMIAVMLKDDVLDTGLRGERVTIDFEGSGVEDDCRHSSKTFVQAYMYGVEKMGGPVAMGSDFNGVAGHFGPRFGNDACGSDDLERSKQLLANDRLPYPFTLDEFGTFDKQVSGQKTFDYNVDGLAHIGLIPDMVADMKNVGLSDADLDPLFRSAEAYIQMWERARGETVREGCTCTGSNFTLDDYGDFENCVFGPGGGLGTGCECFDADGDGDIDLHDFGRFQTSTRN